MIKFQFLVVRVVACLYIQAPNASSVCLSLSCEAQLIFLLYLICSSLIHLFNVHPFSNLRVIGLFVHGEGVFGSSTESSALIFFASFKA